MMEAYDLWEMQDREKEKWLQSRPKCDVCDEHIQDEYLYEIDGYLVCENCLEEYMKKNFRELTEAYM